METSILAFIDVGFAHDLICSRPIAKLYSKDRTIIIIAEIAKGYPNIETVNYLIRKF